MIDACPAHPEVDRGAWARWGSLLMLVLIVIGGGWLRARHLDRQSFWIDESYSLISANARTGASEDFPRGVFVDRGADPTRLGDALPWWKIWTSQRRDVHPPLYFILLRWWREIFGEGDTAARSLSVAASLAGVVLMYGLGREFEGPTAGLWAAAIAAVAGAQIEYAQEARGYAMLAAVATAAAWAAVRIERRGWSRWRGAALASCLTAAVLIHYYGALIAVAIAGYAVLRLRGTVRWRILLAVGTAAMLFLVTWGWALQQQHVAGRVRGWASDPPDGHVKVTWQRAVAVPIRLLGEPEGSGRGWPLVASALLLVLPGVMVWRQPRLLLPYLWMVIVIGGVGVLDLVENSQQLAFIRYTLIAGPALYLMLAVLIDPQLLSGRLRPVAVHALPAAIVLYCIVSLPSAYPEKDNWRGAGEYLAGHAHPGERLVITPTRASIWGQKLFVSIIHYMPPWMPVALVDDPADPRVARALHAGEILWVLSGWESTPPAQLVPIARAEPKYTVLKWAILWRVEVGAGGSDSLHVR